MSTLIRQKQRFSRSSKRYRISLHLPLMRRFGTSPWMTSHSIFDSSTPRIRVLPSVFTNAMRRQVISKKRLASVNSSSLSSSIHLLLSGSQCWRMRIKRSLLLPIWAFLHWWETIRKWHGTWFHIRGRRKLLCSSCLLCVLLFVTRALPRRSLMPRKRRCTTEWRMSWRQRD